MSEFSKDEAVSAALKLAREQFEAFAAMDAPDVPDDVTNAMQVQLMRWQRDRFGLQIETQDLRMALGVIEEMGETFDAETAELALDGLGDTCVYAGQLLMANRLAIAPVLDLARVFASAGGTLVPATGASKLAHVVLKHSQKIRGLGSTLLYQALLVEYLAMCLAKTIDDVEIGHQLAVRAAAVYCIVGEEVMKRKKGDEMIPTSAEVVDTIVTIKTQADLDKEERDAAALRLNALDDLKRANDALGLAEQLEGPGDFNVAEELAKIVCPICQAKMTRTVTNEGKPGSAFICTADIGHLFTVGELMLLQRESL